MSERRHEVATLGGGCFWCLEAVYEQLRGVEKVESGYAGGHVENPTYRQVCTGTTGHAEVVRVTFDPDVVTYREILEVFFATHDPTTPNRQGGDVGPQYRSIILHGSSEQESAARELMRELADEQLFEAPIVTELEPAGEFYPAEEEHHAYYRNNPNQPYCQVVITPKVAKFRSRFRDKLSR